MSKKPLDIETQRLLLRPFVLQDAGDLQILVSNYNIAKMTRSIKHPYKDGMAEAWIAKQERAWDEKSSLNYAIILKQSNKLIGGVGLVGINNEVAEIGYWVGEPYWGKGFCTEAVRALIKLCFDELNIKKVVADCLASNPASGKVLQKVGMTFKKAKTVDAREGGKTTLNVFEIKSESI